VTKYWSCQDEWMQLAPVRYPEWFWGTDDDIQHASIGTSIMGRLSATVVVVCNAARADRTRE
jgi:hypothetical protein